MNFTFPLLFSQKEHLLERSLFCLFYLGGRECKCRVCMQSLGFRMEPWGKRRSFSVLPPSTQNLVGFENSIVKPTWLSRTFEKADQSQENCTHFLNNLLIRKITQLRYVLAGISVAERSLPIFYLINIPESTVLMKYVDSPHDILGVRSCPGILLEPSHILSWLSSSRLNKSLKPHYANYTFVLYIIRTNILQSNTVGIQKGSYSYDYLVKWFRKTLMAKKNINGKSVEVACKLRQGGRDGGGRILKICYDSTFRLLSKCLNIFIPMWESEQEIRIDAFGGESNINAINGSIRTWKPGHIKSLEKSMSI